MVRLTPGDHPPPPWRRMTICPTATIPVMPLSLDRVALAGVESSFPWLQRRTRSGNGGSLEWVLVSVGRAEARRRRLIPASDV